MSLLQNFCEALPLADIRPKRILLQTGAKNYGYPSHSSSLRICTLSNPLPSVHLGPAATPQEEHHARITLEPNFYYPQEDFLTRFSAQHGIPWTIAMPSYILGAVPDAAMNLVYPLGLYASVTAHLRERLAFPGDLRAWEATLVLSSARLNAYLEEWAALSDAAAGEKLNAADGGPFTWGGFWPRFAAWYGVEGGRPSFEARDYRSLTTRHDPPPRGYVWFA